jgi:hypothetical protein
MAALIAVLQAALMKYSQGFRTALHWSCAVLIAGLGIASGCTYHQT